MFQVCPCEANCILGCINNSVASRSSEVIFPLCSALLRLYLECCLSSGLPSVRRTVTEPTDTSWNLENSILNIKSLFFTKEGGQILG